MLTGISTVSRIISGYVKFALRWKKGLHLHAQERSPRRIRGSSLRAVWTLPLANVLLGLKAFISTGTSAG